MPVLSSKAGKYGQDPMGTRFRPIPLLQSIEVFVSMPRESDAYRALRTSLVRGRNAVSDALALAIRTVAQTLEKIETRLSGRGV